MCPPSPRPTLIGTHMRGRGGGLHVGLDPAPLEDPETHTDGEQ